MAFFATRASTTITVGIESLRHGEAVAGQHPEALGNASEATPAEPKPRVNPAFCFDGPVGARAPPLRTLPPTGKESDGGLVPDDEPDTLLVPRKAHVPQQQVCTQPLTKVEKRVVTDILGRVKTAMDAKFATDDPAVGLLDLSGKCAAVDSRLNSTKKRCPAGVKRLTVLLSGLFAMWKDVKSVMRNHRGWVAPSDQEEAFELMGLHLAECFRTLVLIETGNTVKSFWPDVRKSQTLVKRTAAFTAQCKLQGRLNPRKQEQQQQQQQQQQRGDSSHSKMATESQTFRHPSRGKGSGGGGGGSGGSSSSSSTATLSGATSSSSPSLSTSLSVSLLSSALPFTFADTTCESVTIRPSTSLRWIEKESDSSEDTSASSSTSIPSPSRQHEAGSGRQKKLPSEKVTIRPLMSPGWIEKKTNSSEETLVSSSKSISLSSRKQGATLGRQTKPPPESITIRPLTSSRWIERNTNNGSEVTSASSSKSIPPSSRKQGAGLGRQKRPPPTTRKVSVSPGATFVPYRSPACRAFPQGSSLRGSGAVANRKSMFHG